MSTVNDPGPVWGPLQEEMVEALTVLPTDVPGVVETLEQLQGILKRLPPVEQRNPVAVFNTLYTKVTKCVLHDLRRKQFKNPEFMAKLDVEFAERYLVALRRFTGMDQSAPTPVAWTTLFDRRGDRALRPIPAAVVGVNAHVNFDLTFALLTALGDVRPRRRSPEHKDYLHINKIFRKEIPKLRNEFETDLARLVDRLSGTLDDALQSRLVILTRGLAWRRAQSLWPERDDLATTQDVEDGMDRRAALLGRCVLRLRWLQ